MHLKPFDNKLPFDEMIFQNLKAARPYSLLAIILTQAGTAAPTMITLFGDLAPLVAATPIVPALARTGAGVYTLTITGAFPTAGKVPKTGGTIDFATGTRFSIEWTSANVVTIRTFAADGTATDGLLTSKMVEVRVWD